MGIQMEEMKVLLMEIQMEAVWGHLKEQSLESVSDMDGDPDGTFDGDTLGGCVGAIDGDPDGTFDGDTLGGCVGAMDGETDGAMDGDTDGANVGEEVGSAAGT
eukprot:51017_1